MKIIKQYKNAVENAPLEGRIFYLAIAFGFIISLVNVFVNYFLNLHPLTVVITILMSLFCIIMYYVASKSEDFIQIGFVTFLVFIMFFYPFLWFTNGGIAGPTLSVYIFNMALCAIIFDRKQIRILITLELFEVLFLICIEYLFSDLITYYDSKASQLIDNAASTCMLIIATYIITRIIIKEYHLAITELKTTQETLTRLTITDSLTGISNRRHMMDVLKELLRENKAFSLIMMDIDNFKAINDNHGHSVGDTVIKGVASILQNEVRPIDYVGRIGGEEFLLILVDTDEPTAISKAETMRLLVRSNHWPSENLIVTISGGAYARQKKDDFESLLDQVDAYLYEAKSSGKDKINSNI